MIKYKRARHKIWSVFLLLTLGTAWGVIFFGSLVEPRMLVVNEFEAALNDEPTGSVRAVVLSDFHLGPYKKSDWARRIVTETNELKPDIIFLPGDFIFNVSDQADMLYPLADLEAPFGVYAVTGNHDYTDNNIGYVIEALKRYGIIVLENETQVIETTLGPLSIAGINDLWYDGSALTVLRDVQEEDNVILLSHNPDVMLSGLAKPADLVISGHTHGGQIRLPYYGPVSGLPTLMGREYDRGLKSYEDEQLFITSGLGEIGPRARLFNPPEIALLIIAF
ncbi:MAG: metallophosphoesterase [Candidatus Uhrbacteria bacterium]|nr:metallophosphoesterase [Patescibacteria group bacterium]MBU1906687.1 metallophosphoesterase [Patescibacteria group bacterium]